MSVADDTLAPRIEPPLQERITRHGVRIYVDTCLLSSTDLVYPPPQTVDRYIQNVMSMHYPKPLIPFQILEPHHQGTHEMQGGPTAKDTTAPHVFGHPTFLEKKTSTTLYPSGSSHCPCLSTTQHPCTLAGTVPMSVLEHALHLLECSHLALLPGCTCPPSTTSRLSTHTWVTTQLQPGYKTSPSTSKKDGHLNFRWHKKLRGLPVSYAESLHPSLETGHSAGPSYLLECTYELIETMATNNFTTVRQLPPQLKFEM